MEVTIRRNRDFRSAMAHILDNQIWLNVPRFDEQQVKNLGALWDEDKKSYWIEKSFDLQKFYKWLPRMYKPGLKPPHLTCETVPSTSWYQNLRAFLPKHQWDRLRKQTYADAGYCCQVCGDKGDKWPVECNEQWAYEKSASSLSGTQKLLRLTALCPACHSVKHMGKANLEGRVDIAFQQLKFVNSWTDEECEKHIEDAWETWDERSETIWIFDLSVLKKYGIDTVTVDAKKFERLPNISGVSVKIINIHALFNYASCDDL